MLTQPKGMITQTADMSTETHECPLKEKRQLQFVSMETQLERFQKVAFSAATTNCSHVNGIPKGIKVFHFNLKMLLKDTETCSINQEEVQTN